MQRKAAKAELRNLYNAKAKIEERLTKLESRVSQLTHFPKGKSKTHRLIDIEALRSLEEALNIQALVKPLRFIAKDQV